MLKFWVALLLALVLSRASPGAVVTGVVVDNLGGRPLARTRVRVEPAGGAGQGAAVSALTDSGGRFQFVDLPAGVYLLRAQRSGYAEARYGQRQWNGPGTPVTLSAQAQSSVEIRLPKLGAITGQVSDENRVGLPGHRVSAYRARPRLTFASSAETDDRGVYRIAGLEPGRYYVRTEARELEDGQGLLPTFFGRSTRAAESKAVELSLEQEIGGIDIEPLPGRLSVLSGRVQSTQPATVTLFTDTGFWTSRVDPGAAFRFEQLAPGRYDLIAESAAGAEPLAAYQVVEVSRTLEETTLLLSPAPTLRVRCAGGDQSASVFLRRREPPEDGLRRMLCGERASLPPGLWELGVSTPAHQYVASISNATPGNTTYEFDLLRPSSREILITLGSRPAVLRGKVTTGDGQPAVGAPVFLSSMDPELRSRLGGVRSVRSGPDGEYRFLGLAPGKYEVLSSFLMEDAGEAAWTAGRGKSVSLEEAAEETLNLVLAEEP